LLAFDQQADTSFDEWSEDQLSESRRDFVEENNDFEAETKIQFKWRNRKVGSIADIDGLYADKGIWVRGVMVAKLKNGQFLVEYQNWSETPEKSFFNALPGDIRLDCW
jgi:hypothetical protein